MRNIIVFTITEQQHVDNLAARQLMISNYSFITTTLE